MKSQNLRLVIGVIIGAGAMLALGQRSSDSQIGRYQTTSVAPGSNLAFVLTTDTTTGESKIVLTCNPRFTGQLMTPFADMKAGPSELDRGAIPPAAK